MPKTLNSLRNYLFAFLVIGAPFSFVPSIATPVFNFPSFRIGLYQMVAAIFILITIAPLYKDLRRLIDTNKIALYSAAIIASVSLVTLFFSDNQSRGALLTFSLIFLITLLLCSWWFIQFQLVRIPRQFIQAFLLSSLAVATLAIVQLTWGTIADGGGLLCKGCSSAIFGYPRVNVTAAEPLFLASSLLPVLMVSFYLSFKRYRFANISLFAATFTIGLTVARGGYFAAALGVLVLSSLAYFYHKATLKQILLSLSLMLVAGLLSLVFLLGSATLRHHGTTPNITYNTLQSTVEHLTLSLIELPNMEVSSASDTDTSDDFNSPGLINASSTERLDAAELAIDAWQDNPKNILLGTGLGNLGPYVVDNISSTAPSNLTVYIFYVLFLAETGAVGLLAYVTLVASSIPKLFKSISKRPASLIAIGLLVSFLAQYFFFGSYINVVYIWMWLGIFLGLASSKNTLLDDLS